MGEETKSLKLIRANQISVKFDDGNKREDLRSMSFDLLLKRNREKQEFWALKEIDLTAYKGEVLGIIGSNGAGKTTLCRVISEILRPDSGEINVKSQVSALLSMGTGFNPNLTGKDNIYLNGMMMGLSKREMKSYLEEIIEFSGLKEFINQPIKKYSSGMKSRLGFSIAAMIEPETLVLDEALNAGDREFGARASKKMKELVSKANMVILVSHNIKVIEKNCDRGIWINKGTIAAEGEVSEVAQAYKDSIPPRKKRAKKIMNLTETNAAIKENVVVEANNVGIKYKLDKKDFWPLRNLTFSIREGEILGIIGQNGAGKSTLCRALCGILKPDEGTVFADGKATALLNFGTGFSRQLTGEDNIILNGLLLGISKKEIYEMKEEIIEFSGLSKRIHKPIKTYSSGMKARLGFSIAAAIQPELFVIDEALSAGDTAFQEKASERIQEMIERAKAVIVVSHSMGFVEKVCTRALWINEGKLAFDGDAKEAVALYKEYVEAKKKEEKMLKKKGVITHI